MTLRQKNESLTAHLDCDACELALIGETYSKSARLLVDHAQDSDHNTEQPVLDILTGQLEVGQVRSNNNNERSQLWFIIIPVLIVTDVIEVVYEPR